MTIFPLLMLLVGHEPQPGIAARVVRVVDGDTLVAAIDGRRPPVRVRVLGIDCPESKHNDKCVREEKQGRGLCRDQLARGLRATQAARQLLVDDQQTVYLEPEYPGGRLFAKDRYGRLLAYVRLPNGVDFGLAMITAGLCSDFSFRYPHARELQYRRPQDVTAKAASARRTSARPP